MYRNCKDRKMVKYILFTSVQDEEVAVTTRDIPCSGTNGWADIISQHMITDCGKHKKNQ